VFLKLIQIFSFIDALLQNVFHRVPCRSTVAFRLSELKGTKGRSNNQKCQIICKINEKDEGKYNSICDIIKL
jgi:hypothetical protein